MMYGKMYGTSNIIFVVLAGIGSLLVTMPLPKALASGNVGTSMLIVWSGLACLVQFVNAIRWNRNIENWAPSWYDFCGYFLIVADLGLVTSAVSINRSLYMIVTLDPRRHERAFNAVVNVVLCLVIPWASIALQYVVQRYRFYIYEDIGCISGVGIVDLSFPLVWMLPLFVGVVSAGYACLTIRASLQRNHGLMKEAEANSAWSCRLISLGVVSTMYGLIPTSISIALLATTYPVAPWPGWRAIHSTINVIIYVPALEWQSSSIQIACTELRRWTTVTLTFVVFVFLGLTADMKKMYRAPFRSANDTLGQRSSRNVLDSERNADGHPNDKKAFRLSPSRRDYHLPFEKWRTTNRHESFGLTDRPGSDSDLEGLRLVLPVYQSCIHTTEPTYTSWKSHYEGHDYHA